MQDTSTRLNLTVTDIPRHGRYYARLWLYTSLRIIRVNLKKPVRGGWPSVLSHCQVCMYLTYMLWLRATLTLERLLLTSRYRSVRDKSGSLEGLNRLVMTATDSLNPGPRDSPKTLAKVYLNNKRRPKYLICHHRQETLGSILTQP